MHDEGSDTNNLLTSCFQSSWSQIVTETWKHSWKHLQIVTLSLQDDGRLRDFYSIIIHYLKYCLQVAYLRVVVLR